MNDDELPPSLRSSTGDAAPAEPPRPSTMDVVQNAAYGGVAAIPDALLNVPNQVVNLAKAGVGTVATAAGRPDLAPDLTPDPDITRKTFQKLGLIRPNVTPQGFQKALDLAIRGGTSGALTGGSSLSRVLMNAGMGVMSALSGGGGATLAKKLGMSDSQIQALAATFGMAGSAGVARAGRGLSKPSDEVKTLDKEGVSLTPGQMVGGWSQRMEDALSSIPFLGDVIKSRQRAGLESFGTAAMNRALDPVGKKLPEGLKGHEAIRHVQDTLSGEYGRVLSGMQAHLDSPPGAPLTQPTLRGDLGQMLGQAQAKLPADRYQELEKLVRSEIVDEFNRGGPGVANGEKVKQIESLLGKTASDMGLSNNYHDRQMADFVRQAKDAVHKALYTGNPPDKVKELEAVDAGWANFKRLQRASGSVATDQGVFTPAQLHNAAKAGDFRKDKGNFSRGEALMQDLTGAGKSVLSQKVPDSGTARRVMVEALAAGGAGGAHLVSPELAATTLGGMALYSPPVQRAVQELMMGRYAQPLAEASRRSVVPLSATMQDNQK